MIYKVLDFQLSFDRTYFGYKFRYFVKYVFGEFWEFSFEIRDYNDNDLVCDFN